MNLKESSETERIARKKTDIRDTSTREGTLMNERGFDWLEESEIKPEEKAILDLLLHPEEGIEGDGKGQSEEGFDLLGFLDQLREEGLSEAGGSRPRAENPEERRSYSCGYTTRPRSDLVGHIRRRHGGWRKRRGEPLYCSLCAYSTLNRETLGQHLSSAHTGERPYACPECPFSTASRSYLEIHRDSHRAEKKHACPHCRYTSARKDYLDNHVVSKHFASKKRYPCQECGFVALLRHHLARHTAVHTGSKPSACPEPGCSYSTAYDYDLVKHLRRHTGERPYKCSSCVFRTAHGSDLRKHEAKRHRAAVSPVGPSRATTAASGPPRGGPWSLT